MLCPLGNSHTLRDTEEVWFSVDLFAAVKALSLLRTSIPCDVSKRKSSYDFTACSFYFRVITVVHWFVLGGGGAETYWLEFLILELHVAILCFLTSTQVCLLYAIG